MALLTLPNQWTPRRQVLLHTRQTLRAQARDITGVLIIANVIHLQAVVLLPRPRAVALWE